MRNISEKDEEILVLRFIAMRLLVHWKWLLASLICAFGAAIVIYYVTDIPKRLLDEALATKDWHKLIVLSLSLAGIIGIDGIIDFAHRITLRVAMERTIRKLRMELFERFLVTSQDQAADSSSGKAITHVLSDTAVIGQGLHIVADIFREPLVLIAVLYRMLTINWRLTLICFVALPVVFGFGRLLGRSARRSQSSIQRAIMGITSHITETMGGLRTAHAFVQTPKLREEFDRETLESYVWSVRLARIEEIVSPLTKFIASCAGAGLIILGGWFVIRGEMTPGGIVSFITSAALLQQPLKQLNQVNVRLQQIVAAGRRIYDLVMAPLDDIGHAQKKILESPSIPKTGDQKAPALEFKNVSFRYPAAQGANRELALREVSLTVKPGMRLALVGQSGSGKTTLSLLAMRFLDPSQGQVVLGGKAARSWELGEYRSHFSYVSQDVFLFNRTVRENMLFARANATDAEIWQALERASIREFIEKLPNKLDTNLAEHAGNLSGGERQRIAIARAFLKDAPFLILDEATSQLDALSEQAVQKALSELMENRSVLVIAHRLATIREVDEVAVFEAGQIVEYGRPELLLNNPQGSFSKLWAAQGGANAVFS